MHIVIFNVKLNYSLYNEDSKLVNGPKYLAKSPGVSAPSNIPSPFCRTFPKAIPNR